MTKKYLNTPESRELKILGALADGTATDKEIKEVVDDINSHLKTLTGTLQNYNGRFQKACLKSLQENYGLFKNEEFYTAQKAASIFNALASRIISGNKIQAAPQLIKMILDYMKGVDDSTNSFDSVRYVTIGYEWAKDGQFTLPQPKRFSN